MSSFFEKLKKGMDANAPEEEFEKKAASKGGEPRPNKFGREEARAAKETKENDLPKKSPPKACSRGASALGGDPPRLEKRGRPRKQLPKQSQVEEGASKIAIVSQSQKTEQKESSPAESGATEDKELKEGSPVKEKGWFEKEGQLVVDVYETEDEIVIMSAIAGVKPENLDISIENDTVLIKGKREKAIEEKTENYFYQECYWGFFSREIILPAEVDGARARASMQDGVLIIRIPRIDRDKKRKITVK